MQKILVIGSTGMLGKPVTKELIRNKFDVTLMTRDNAKTAKLFPGVRTIRGDVLEKDKLAHAMKGQDIVYINLSISQSSNNKDKQPEREGIENILMLAKEHRIKRIVYLSSLIHFYNGMNGFHWWAFDIKSSAVNKIKASGIPYTIFYPSTFMESFPYQMMEKNRIILVGKSIASLWFIAADDFAIQVSRSLQFADWANHEYIIQGPEPFNYDQAAEVFIQNYPNSNLKIFRAPLGLLKFLGNFIPKIKYGAKICDALNKYPEKFESEKTWRELGRPIITLAEFAKQTRI